MKDKPLFGLKPRDHQTIIEILGKYPEIQEVKLFGSRAKGNFKPGSDIDLSITTDFDDDNLALKLSVDFEESSLPYNVDLVFYRSISNQAVKEHIDRVGVLIFSKNSPVY
ncbi:MAG: nucleotidyltransferase domain-containing protein [Leptospiraceae bacterium]|nr:nucleotidyltransferase domain-containing protein [Leptospiraceae bacterium]MCP5502119.1 nucleotidyltransferase domain-containing protein [Leptospiraceae bacterium]